ncbi:excinuclease ABC subunit UvrA [Paenibacillus mesophilus]|uniref:ATP-binding cassette domain-containing protein n=1 Tax=Paenibacillus mesophilus TaxID=2582849 RepID=UPI00110F1C77|nr:excinuclease ABC subunit UvrA [Paenibacillus mesophilus]TMV49666.1 excinuclease ABC subunit UvrA [Paenibacillus mesophilus]
MSKPHEPIQFEGVREHNLAGIDVYFPKRNLTVVVGVSGSGKSSLIFDVLCKEADRQYLMTTGKIADHLQRPHYERVHNLSPVVSVSQQSTNHNPRSTVGTFSELYTYLRLLYVTAGDRPCPNCRAVVAVTDYEHKSQCPACRSAMPPLTLAHLSYNTPLGACDTCKGLGDVLVPDPAKLLDPALSIMEGGMLAWKKGVGRFFQIALTQAANHYKLPFTEADMSKPIGELPPIILDLLLYGTDDARLLRLQPQLAPPKTAEDGRFEGAVPAVARRFFDNPDHMTKEDSELRSLMKKSSCPACNGTRLSAQAMSVTVHGSRISDITPLSMSAFVNKLEEWRDLFGGTARFRSIEPIMHELEARARSLVDVGLSYLGMDRPFYTLSGGEAQRVRLASSLHSELTDLVFVYDEPSSGLHPKDTSSIFQSLRQLKDKGNTVIVVEHNLSILDMADHIIEIGPESGVNGGRIVVQGTLEQLSKAEQSVTRLFLNQRQQQHSAAASERKRTRSIDSPSLQLVRASERNLKRFDAAFPLGAITAIAGVSGSGKTTLLFDVLLRRLRDNPDKVEGARHIERIVVIEQDEMGRSSRSNAATYTGVFDPIRGLFGEQAKRLRLPFKASHFSFNVKGGRCEKCLGHGKIKLDMHFMPDAFLECDRCEGKRYDEEILAVNYEGLSIADVLDLSIHEAAKLFEPERAIKEKLDLLVKLGLGYIKLGQPASTLSGGEAHRVKLAAELGLASKKHTLYLLDEPSSGLHPRDAELLGGVLGELADRGGTVIFIDHKPMLLRRADWIIELGPCGGEQGGYLLCQGMPAQLSTHPASQIGPFLQQ